MRANTKGSGAAALRAVVVVLAALAAGAGAARPLALEAKPALVPVGVYVESLCPGCRNFISTMLRSAVAKGLGAIMDLTIVPYGNAKASSGGVRCQVSHRTEHVWRVAKCHFQSTDLCSARPGGMLPEQDRAVRAPPLPGQGA